MVKISNDKLTVSIAKTGSEIQSILGADGTEYIWNGDPAFWPRRATILFPICSGIKNGKYTVDGKEYFLDKHGFLKTLPFEVESITDTKVVLVTRDTEETLKVYPWSFEFRTIFELSDENLTATYSVTNKSDSKMYFSVGAHEGYACPNGIEDFKVVFEKKEDLKCYLMGNGVLTDKYVVLGKDTNELKMLYDYFTVGTIILRELESRKVMLTDGKREITVDFNGFNHLLLWTKPDAGYLCIEPWNGLPDVEGSGYEISEKASIIPLDAGKVYDVTHKMSFKTVG